MRQSESIANLAKALVGAQLDIDNASKNSTNPGLKNKYADLSSVREACHEPFQKHGLVVVQGCESSDDNRVHLATRLIHESGEWIESLTVVPVGAPNSAQTPAQCFGSALTYARRYALAAIAGITQEDDDGNGAGQHHATPPVLRQHQQPTQQPSQPRTAPSAPQSGNIRFDDITAALGRLGMTEQGTNGNPKPTRDGFAYVSKLGVPKKWGEWTDGQKALVMNALLAEEKQRNQGAPADDEEPPQLDFDPFADQ